MEGPFSVVLEDWIADCWGMDGSLVGDDVLAGVIAVGRACPG